MPLNCDDMTFQNLADSTYFTENYFWSSDFPCPNIIKMQMHLEQSEQAEKHILRKQCFQLKKSL